MFPIGWLKQLGKPLFTRPRATRQSRSGWHALRHSPARLCLETLEERCLLDATPQIQLASHLSKLALDLTREAIDTAVFVDEIAIASGEGTAAGLAGLVALAPVMKYPAMILDSSSLVKDFHEGNTKAAFGDLLSLSGHTIFAIVGDHIAIEQDEMDILNDIRQLLAGTSTPQSRPTPSPAPAPTSSIIGTYSASLVPSSVIGDPDETSSRTVNVSFNKDGSGSLYISSFQQKPVSVTFPTGTAQYDSSGGLLSGIHYAVNSDWSIDIGVSDVANKGQQIVADIDYESQNTPDGIFFISDTLNRQ